MKSDKKSNWIVTVAILAFGIWLGIIIGSAPFYTAHIDEQFNDMEYQTKFYTCRDAVVESVNVYNKCATVANTCIDYLEDSHKTEFKRLPIISTTEK